MPDLPLELLLRVVDDVAADPSGDAFTALLACGATCRAFRPIVQKRLFSVVELFQGFCDLKFTYGGLEKGVRHAELFTSIIQAHPSTANHIHTLHLNLSLFDPRYYTGLQRHREPIRVCLTSIVLLKSITTFTLQAHGMNWALLNTHSDVSSALKHLLSLAILTELSLDGLSGIPLDVFGLIPNVRRMHLKHVRWNAKIRPTLALSGPLTIKSLTVLSPRFVNEIGNLCSIKLEDGRSAIDWSSLETLDVKGPDSLATGLRLVIGHGATNMSEIRLADMRAKNDPMSIEGLAEAFDTWECNKLLRLSLSMTDMTGIPTLRQLCSEIEKMGSSKQGPHLVEEICLNILMMDFGSQNYHEREDDWRRLASLLANKRTWPRLHRVYLNVVEDNSDFSAGKKEGRNIWDDIPSRYMDSLSPGVLRFRYKTDQFATAVTELLNLS